MNDTFETVLIDPPWPEFGGGKVKRGADRHYPLIKTKEDIRATIFSSEVFQPAPNSHLYLWVTNNCLPWAVWLIPELGFRYVTCITWAKPSIGIGQYFRGQTGQLLFAVKGDGLRVARRHRGKQHFSTLLKAERAKKDGKPVHSAKPEAAYRMIELASPAPRLEMFARRSRKGWSAWGNEV